MSHVMPRPLAGLAAAGLVAAVLGVPLLAYADTGTSATPSATPESAGAAKGTADPSTTPSSTQEEPSAETSAAATPSPESASPSSAPASSAEPTEPEEPQTASKESASPSHDALQPGVALDGVQAPQSEAEAAEPEGVGARVQAQAEGPTEAGISLTKTASPSRVSKVGQVITYRFVATNTGALDLTNVAISDELEGLSELSCDQSGAATLAPEQALRCSATLTVTQEVLDFGDIDNFATVFGEYDIEGQGDYVGANAAAHVSVVQQSSIGLKATVAPSGKADRGDRLRYAATATNTGNVTLTSARITSNLQALDLTCQPAARTTLAPGASMSCSGVYRVSRADASRGRVSATLTARAEQPYGDPGDSSDDVTNSRTLRVAVTKPASSSHENSDAASSGASGSDLADSGSPQGSLLVGLFGAVLTASGIGLIRRGRRR